VAASFAAATETLPERAWVKAHMGTRLSPHLRTRESMKFSTKRLIVSGNYVEIYSYSKPYSFGSASLVLDKSCISGDNMGFPVRREDNLRRAQNTLRRVVNANEVRGSLFGTLTYQNSKYVAKDVVGDFKAFIRRARGHFGTMWRYVAVLEYHQKGDLHVHVGLFGLPWTFEQEKCCGDKKGACWAFRDGYCPHKAGARALAILWGHGFVDVTDIRNCRNVGAYISKYLSKGLDDRRLKGEKCFFRSRNTVTPEMYRDPVGVDNKLAIIEQSGKLELLYESSRVSEQYGLVRYQQKKICGA